MTDQSLIAAGPEAGTATLEQTYEHADTRELVELVNAAADLVRAKGKAAFDELRGTGSRWRKGEMYIFVLDLDGKMLVHPDPALEGKNQLELKDVNGKGIIRGLLGAATTQPEKAGGWYHYQWPVPGGLLPRWKSSYVRLVTPASGESVVVGCGLYNDRMERAFVVDLVTSAVHELETFGVAAPPLFRDPKGPFIAKDAYIFVIDMDGTELVNPAFPTLQGRSLLDLKDTQGKLLVREMIQVAETRGSGWVDYMWPRPGESVSTRKSTYVSRGTLGGKPVVVACGVYLADAPREAAVSGKLTAAELMALVRDAGAVLEEKGAGAYGEFRQKGSRWFGGDTYVFVWTMEGRRVFHGADPSLEGKDASGLTDVLGRAIGRMILEAAAGPSGEGWVHYMYPEPESIFPAWKSTFVKRVNFPSGKAHIVGCGIYNLQTDRTLIEDVVGRAAALIGERGKEAFVLLRDRTGPFVFMDTYVFVHTPDGIELVNPAQPTLEGRNLLDLRDLQGKAVIREQVAIAERDGSGWLDCYWYKPGDNTPARKRTYVRKAQFGQETYIVGSGIYIE